MFISFKLLQDYILSLRKKEEENGSKMFLGIPDFWFEKPGPKYRCQNDHVSRTILKTDGNGDRCLACGGNVLMTFPEDKDNTPLI